MPGEEVAERVLEGEAEDDADRAEPETSAPSERSGKKYLRIERAEQHVGDEREDVADEARRLAPAAHAEDEIEDERARQRTTTSTSALSSSASRDEVLAPT